MSVWEMDKNVHPTFPILWFYLAELAHRAGIRLATLTQIESDKHSPSVAAVEKIDPALSTHAGRGPFRKPRVG